MTGGPGAPDWLRPLLAALRARDGGPGDGQDPATASPWVAAPGAGAGAVADAGAATAGGGAAAAATAGGDAGVERRSAVLVLFGEGPAGPDLLLTERGRRLRHHPGQPAFPGGAAEVADAGPAATALREAAEETGLDPAGVLVLATLPAVRVARSGYDVVPVLGYWARPTPVAPVDLAEVAAVARVPLAEFADPAHRVRLRHPSGWVGPGFEVADLLVWGFTAGLIDRLLALGGFERPWRPGRLRELAAAPPPAVPGPIPPGPAASPG